MANNPTIGCVVSSACAYVQSAQRHVHLNALTDTGAHGNCEIDNHADIHCFGANFCPLFFTGQICNVNAFLSLNDAVQNVEICTLFADQP